MVASTIPTRFEEDASLFTSVWWWGSETSCHRGQTPLFDIRFYENEPTLPKINVNCTRSVRADGGEEILGFETVSNVVKLFAVPGEKDGACSGAVTDANDITLDVFGAVFCRVERLIEATVTGGGVGY